MIKLDNKKMKTTNFLIIVLLTVSIYSCRWDTRRNYKYVEYNGKNEVVKSENFLVIADSVAYIKAFENFSTSNSKKFELFNENGEEISKKVDFTTKAAQEMEIKALISERKRNEEIVSKLNLKNKVVVNESIINENNDLETLLKNSKVIGIWDDTELNKKLILIKKNNKKYLIDYSKDTDFKFYEKDYELFSFKSKNRDCFIIKWLAESTISDYDIDISTTKGIDKLIDNQFYYYIDSNGNLLYNHSNKLVITFLKSNDYK